MASYYFPDFEVAHNQWLALSLWKPFAGEFNTSYLHYRMVEATDRRWDWDASKYKPD